MSIGKEVRSDHDHPGGRSEEECYLGYAKPRSKGVVAIKSNVMDHSMDEDKYQKGTRQRKAMKYLRESYYHRIECFAANSLAALMRK